MADPFRLRVLKALTTELKKVSPENTRPDGLPFVHDLTDFVDADGIDRARVYRGRDWFGASDPLPLVSILERPEPADLDESPVGATHGAGEYELILQGFVEDDPLNPTDPAHVLAAEVIAVLVAARTQKKVGSRRESDILGFGDKMPCVGDIHIAKSPVVRPATEGISSVAFFYLPITLDLYEDLANPFA